MQIGIDLGATKIEYVLLDNNNIEIKILKNIPPFTIKNKQRGIRIIELINLLINSFIFKYYQNFF